MEALLDALPRMQRSREQRAIHDALSAAFAEGGRQQKPAIACAPRRFGKTAALAMWSAAALSSTSLRDPIMIISRDAASARSVVNEARRMFEEMAAHSNLVYQFQAGDTFARLCVPSGELVGICPAHPLDSIRSASIVVLDDPETDGIVVMRRVARLIPDAPMVFVGTPSQYSCMGWVSDGQLSKK